MQTAERQVIAIEKFGPAKSLALRQRPREEVGDDDVAIAVKYSGINFADIQMRLGFYPDAPKRPFVPGYEVSGTVEQVGKNVARFKVGDPVVAGTYFGGYASQVSVPAIQAFPLPQSTGLAEAAALPVSFFTAELALFEMGRVRAGDRVLIECATGGVGTLAVQMALRAGAEVVGLTTTAAKKQYIAALGATPYTRDEFFADPSINGFDFILQASGGKDIKRQLPRLGLTGRMVCMGLNSGVNDGKRDFVRIARAVLSTPRLSVLDLLNHNQGVFGLNALHVLRDPKWVEKLTAKLERVTDMQLAPHVGKVFPANEAAAAHRYLETRQATGKVLLEW
ncbi:MAG: zinc-binding dehydrogenase [Myxococcales bacterium]|nr:zinc-binding dehydrogenase [Myxococcales bacterium]